MNSLEGYEHSKQLTHRSHIEQAQKEQGVYNISILTAKQNYELQEARYIINLTFVCEFQ